MKNVLSTILLLAVLVTLFLLPGCKKDSVTKTVPLSRSFDFKASAATPMAINISITRPSGNININIDAIGLKNVTGQYEFKPLNVQAGDKMVISVTTDQNQPITSSITINGVDIPHTTLSLSDPGGMSSVSWNTVVN